MTFNEEVEPLKFRKGAGFPLWGTWWRVTLGDEKLFLVDSPLKSGILDLDPTVVACSVF
jgi:hypothetical protein